MFKKILFPVFLMFFLMCDNATNNETVQKGEYVDQFCYYENGGGGLEITQNQTVIQTFTVGRSGTLTRITIPHIKHHSGIPKEDLRFKLFEMDSISPIMPELVAINFPSDSVPDMYDTSYALEIDLLEYDIQVEIGDYLGIELSTDASSSGATYGWGAEYEAYDFGTTIINDFENSIRDMVFATYVLTK